jgi:hypothetical protein
MKRILTGLMLLLPLAAVGQTVKPQQATLTQQKMCAEQARKVFHDLRPLHPAFIEWDYTSHYDTKSNRCFIETSYIDSDTLSLIISDAFESREYASFDRYKGVIGICDVTRPGHDKENCKSEDEFSALADKYFGIGR